MKPEEQKRRMIGIVAVLILIFGIAVFVSRDTEAPKSRSIPSVQSTPQERPQKPKVTPETQSRLSDIQNFLGAIKDLQEIELVHSYEEPVVYVTKEWVLYPAPDKKELVRMLSVLKEKATGFHRIEIRDVISNEKYAEVTAFTGSVEIYK